MFIKSLVHALIILACTSCADEDPKEQWGADAGTDANNDPGEECSDGELDYEEDVSGCVHAETDYQPRENNSQDDSWDACISDDGEYHKIEESVSSIKRLAPHDVPTVMSSQAWADYDVPVAPFFVLVDGESGEVIGEGSANDWGQVQSLVYTALADAGFLDRKGAFKGNRRGKPRADLLREARADRDLLAAGIQPGDPSLYTLPSTDLPEGGTQP